MVITKKPINKEHYVDNTEFTKAVVAYNISVVKSKKKNERSPKIPEYIGECVLKIAVRLSFRPNFIGYSFREEMIGDGIENSLMYIYNFDPKKSTNAFAYITQIIYYAFIRRIAKEKRQFKIREDSMSRSGVFNKMYEKLPMDPREYGNQRLDNLQHEFAQDKMELDNIDAGYTEIEKKRKKQKNGRKEM